MRFIFCCTLLVIVFGNSLAQVEEINELRFEIIDDMVNLKRDQKSFDLNIKVSNDTKTNYLFYNFRTVEPGFLRQQNCADGSSFGARTMISIKNLRGKTVPISAIDINDGQPVTEDSLSKVLADMHNIWINNKIVLRAHDSKVITIHINIGLFKLTKGKYSFHIFYRAGTFVQEFLGKSQVAMDTKNENANLFLGCLTSNTIKLIIE
jgi:hypothetical protein